MLMPTLFYSPGACSMASHIALEESGAKYEAQPVQLAKGEHLTPEYKKINPRSKVPALRLDDGAVVTENTAILQWIGRSFPQKSLLPKDEVGQVRCISTCAWLSNTVHPAFTHVFRPERFTTDESARDGVKEAGKKTFFAGLQEIDGLIDGNEWLMGSQFTVCDPYALVFYGWGSRIELPVKELKSYTAWKERMLQRPAVRAVLEREKSPLLAA
jgi:glutathione S-transferase